TLEEMGGAHMHCSTSGCGDALAKTETEAIEFTRRYLSYFPANFRKYPEKKAVPEAKTFEKTIEELVPVNQNVPFDMKQFIERIIDADSFCEIKKLFAKEVITGLARIDGESVGIIANQPRSKGGVLFPDSADKTAKLIQLCDAFNIPLLFLLDVSCFMIGTKVESQGIIRHGAKMLAMMSEATVPKISVVVRKAYGAGLYAMAGPAFETDAVLALPTAQIAVMGPEAAINAVYANKIAALDEEDRAAFVKEKQDEYREDIDVYNLASEMVVDHVVQPSNLRAELINRYEMYESKNLNFTDRKHGVYPV